jgi:putative membrane protein
MRNKPTGTTNELAKERNREAAERTLTSWIQNCLSLIGFGIAFARIFSAINRSFPKNSLLVNIRLTHIIGLNAIAIGVFLLIIAVLTYLTEIKSIPNNDYPLPRFFYATLMGSVILFGFVTFIITLIIPY